MRAVVGEPDPGPPGGDPDAVLAALDPEQRQVALAVTGPVCVLAGAGTGKTRAVAHRIAYAALAGVVDPAHVLAVTFTTRAAGEMRARLVQLAGSGGGLERVQARTFHSAALRQLTHFWPATVGGRPPAVLDSKVSLLAEAARGLRLTAAILAEHGQAAAEVRDRYRYFVIDEYQDVNPLQKLLLDSWAGDRDDVCVVGDPRQTIYSFAGATAAFLIGFTAEFPDATVIELVRNYRSTPQVITLANRLTGAAGPRSLAEQLRTGGPLRSARPRHPVPSAALVAQRPAGPAAEFCEYPDEEAEASAVAARADTLRAAGLAPGQMAVLVRTNAQTLALERALAERGVPCQVRGADRFFDRPEVRQATGLLRAAAKSASSSAGSEPSAEVRHILAGLGLTREAPAGRGAARERWESLEALAQLAADYFAAHPDAALAGFVSELGRRSAIEHAPAIQGVTLASLHAAKGLEWDVVFLPGLTEGTLPIVYAQTEEAIEEERRLLYVGVTRARERIFLSWSLARSPGGRRTRKPSRFLGSLRR